jgi:hypothetical protein
LAAHPSPLIAFDERTRGLTVRLPPTADADFFEGALAALIEVDDRAQSVDLVVTDYERFGLLGEARLLTFLLHARAKGVALSASTGDRTGSWDDFPLKYKQLFLGTLAGLLIGQFAEAVVNKAEVDHVATIQELQPDRIEASEGLLGQRTTFGDEQVGPGYEITVPFLDRWAGGHTPPKTHALALTPPRSDFVTDLEALWDGLGVHLGSDRAEAFGTFLHEAFENAADHGGAPEDQAPEQAWPTLRFLLVRRSKSFSSDRYAGGSSVFGLSDYLRHLRGAPSWLKLQSLRRHSGAQLLELTVADAGIGIGATMGDGRDVYDEPVEREFETLQRAMQHDGTRYSEWSGRGLGFPNMLYAAESSDGLLLVRSGRVGGFQHFLGRGREADGLELSRDHPLPFIHGTTVTLLLVAPLDEGVHSRQLVLESELEPAVAPAGP